MWRAKEERAPKEGIALSSGVDILLELHFLQ